MTGRFATAIAFVAALGSASGCGRSPAARFYLLNPTATADGGPLLRDAIVVDPVSVPGAVDRPQLVLQAAPNRVTLDEFNRWASPLAEEIARTVAGNLAALLGTPHVAAAPLPNFEAAYRIAIEVQRFDTVPGRAAIVDAVWTVQPPTGRRGRSGRTVAEESVADPSIDALVAAHERALATVSSDIARAIRTAK